MKRIGINILLILILVVTLVIGTSSVAYALPPQRVFIDITEVSDSVIVYDFSWEKKEASYYQICIYKEDPIPDYQIYSDTIDLGGRTPEYSSWGYWLNEEIEPGYRYYVSIRLLAKNGRVIKHAFAIDSESS